jgi:hypothetical protein
MRVKSSYGKFSFIDNLLVAQSWLRSLLIRSGEHHPSYDAHVYHRFLTGCSWQDLYKSKSLESSMNWNLKHAILAGTEFKILISLSITV